MTRLSDLSPEQIRLMVKLDDGFDHIDSVGRKVSDLRGVDDLDIGELVILGLIVTDEGRNGEVWVRLTERGRLVREEGEA